MTRCPLLLASCITFSLLTPAAFAHGHRHGNDGAQVASLGKSPTTGGFLNDAATTTDASSKPDTKLHGAASSDTHLRNGDKAQRKSVRAPDEEELMQAEH